MRIAPNTKINESNGSVHIFNIGHFSITPILLNFCYFFAFFLYFPFYSYRYFSLLNAIAISFPFLFTIEKEREHPYRNSLKSNNYTESNTNNYTGSNTEKKPWIYVQNRYQNDAKKLKVATVVITKLEEW